MKKGHSANGDSPAGSDGCWRAILRTAGLVRRLSGPHFARFNSSGTQWGVLKALHRLEQRGEASPRINDLRNELLIQPPSLSVTLDRMERAGLVQRSVDSEDARSRRINLTPAGRELMQGAQSDHSQWIEQMLAGLGKHERAHLKELLEKLCNHLSSFPDAASPPASISGSRKANGRTTE